MTKNSTKCDIYTYLHITGMSEKSCVRIKPILSHRPRPQKWVYTPIPSGRDKACVPKLGT